MAYPIPIINSSNFGHNVGCWKKEKNSAKLYISPMRTQLVQPKPNLLTKSAETKNYNIETVFNANSRPTTQLSPAVLSADLLAEFFVPSRVTRCLEFDLNV
jgi:hypothetical protein